MKLSGIILTKNNAKQIDMCIKTLQFCDEIVVIDDDSSDNTRDAAKKAGAKVYSHSLAKNFSLQRNYGLEKAQGEWALFVDSDERVSSTLAKEILSNISQTQEYKGYLVKRQDHMWGRILHHGETGNISLLRLAKKDAGLWKGSVHEIWNISGPTKTMSQPLDHYPHPTIAEFLQDINDYTDMRAVELHRQGTRAGWFSIIAFPAAKFIKNYIFLQGFLDGSAGMVHALLMSLHSFLVRGKLYSLTDQ